MSKWTIRIILGLFSLWMLAGVVTGAPVTSVNQGQFALYTSTHKLLFPCVDIFDGTAGEQGPRGFSGYSGLAGTITINSVSGVPYGTPPSITNIGTASAALLDILIPAGEPGTPGSPDTQAQILEKIATPTVGTILTIQAGTGDTVSRKLEIRDEWANLRSSIWGTGTIYTNYSSGRVGTLAAATKTFGGIRVFPDLPAPRGYMGIGYSSTYEGFTAINSSQLMTFNITPSGDIEISPDGVKSFKYSTIDRSLTMYRGDGVTEVFSVMSTGRMKLKGALTL